MLIEVFISPHNHTTCNSKNCRNFSGLYCSCDSDCDSNAQKLRAGVLQSNGKYLYGLEQLLYQYGVDLWLNGHEHNYERMYDIEPKEIYTYLSGSTTRSTKNPPGTIYIVTGDGGNYENHEGDIKKSTVYLELF